LPTTDLKWLQAPLDLFVPDGLKDFEVGWFTNLLRASLRSEIPGLLLCNEESLWRLAGARNPQSFGRKSTVITAAFKPAQTSDGRQAFCFPPLLEAVQNATRKLAAYKPRLSTESTGVDEKPRRKSGGAIALNLNLPLDFDVGSKIENDASARKPPAPQYTQADFDERDFRKLDQAIAAVQKTFDGRWIVDEYPAPPGAVSRRQIIEQAAQRAGVSCDRAMQLVSRAKERSA